MNPNAKNFKVRPCVVCGYPLSDRHHLYPRHKRGEKMINLCPNHHRFANILQIIFDNSDGDGYNEAKAFALEHFDKEFNEKVLDLLLQAYCTGVFYIDLLGLGEPTR